MEAFFGVGDTDDDKSEHSDLSTGTLSSVGTDINDREIEYLTLTLESC